MSVRCLCCGKPLPQGIEFYHPSCRRKLFGKDEVPVCNYSFDELNARAKEHVLSRVSVPGVQPKLSLHLERPRGRGTSRLTLVGLDGDYILKPPVAQWPELPEAEHFCMNYARLCGLQTASFGLVPLRSGELAYLTRRMDRMNGRPRHMEDFCQILENPTERKYAGSHEQIARALMRHSTSPGLDALRFYELTLFNFVTGNSDMHLKNFSLLHVADGRLELSPAYDLVPVRIILPEDREELALTLNGKKNKLKCDDFHALAETLRLTFVQRDRATQRLMSVIRKMKEPALAASFLSTDKQKQISTLIESRLKRLDD